jgi:hypothetical protein
MKKCNPWNAGVRLGRDRSIHLSYVPERISYLILKHSAFIDFFIPSSQPQNCIKTPPKFICLTVQLMQRLLPEQRRLTCCSEPDCQSLPGPFTVSKLYQNPDPCGLLEILNCRKADFPIANKKTETAAAWPATPPLAPASTTACTDLQFAPQRSGSISSAWQACATRAAAYRHSR